MRKLIAGFLAATLFTTMAQGKAKPAADNASPALWVVRDKDTTIYLFGTIHVLKPGLQWFDGGVKKAYDASSEVMFEMVEPDAATAQKMVLEKAVDPDGPPLTKKLPPATAEAYGKAMAGLGLPTAGFETLEPWFVSNMITMFSLQKLGYDPNSGVEKQLTEAAKKDGKTLGELESMQFQLNLFDTLPEKLQLDLFTQTLDELPKGSKLIDDMVSSWAKGDPDMLAKQMNEDMDKTPELAKILLTDRNTLWADKIKARLDKPGTVFIAVGAGHLAGAGSVLDLLKARKVNAKRITS
jgi:uncharacterized protein YbaP (TraB family)